MRRVYAIEELTAPFSEPLSSMTFTDLVDNFLEIINFLIPLIVMVVLVVLIWKLIDMFIISAGDQQALTNGKRTVVIAVVALVVVLSIWGILALLRASIFAPDTPILIPV